MRIINQRSLVAAAALCVLALYPGLLRESGAQTPSTSIRTRVVVVGANQRCQPAWVRYVSFGAQPRDAVLAQVGVENTSFKTITAVKLGWKVYPDPEGMKISLSYCDAQPTRGQSLLSGVTPLIQLQSLVPNETCNIGIKPLPVPPPFTRTVFVDRPFLMTEDLKSLSIDGETPKIKYTIVMYVSEVHFDDGTAWEAATSKQ